MLRILRTWIAAVAILSVLSTTAHADLYVLQIGDGTDATHITAGNAAPIIINKFADSGGSSLASVAMPTATSGANSLFTTRGNSTTESFMHVSTNGQYLVLAGVAATVGTALPGASGAFPRVVGRVDVNNFTGAGVNTTTVFNDGFLGNSFRSVASTNGTDFWMSGAGTGGGIRYTTLGSTTSALVSNTTANTRVTGIFNDASNQPQLYSTSGSAGFLGVSSVGTGLPTTSGATMTLLTSSPSDTSTNAMDFWFKDAATVYKANGTGGSQGIAKYTFNSGTSTWDFQYLLPANVANNTGAGGLTGVVSGGTTTLYATNYANELISIVDTGASSVPTVLATAPTNTTFRGIAFVPSAAGITGDYNNDGKVDAGDYVTWEKAEGTNNVLANDPIGGTIGAGQYNQWRANFGKPPGAGSGLEGAAVPEPASAVLLVIGLAAFCSRRRSA